MLDPDTFEFLGEVGSIPDPSSWDDARKPKLWLYNLHYFDYLSAQDANSKGVWHTQLLTRWVEENPPTEGNAWEPYPVSLRICNWVKWSITGNPLPDQCENSLAVQARWLRKRLEWHLLGNHLFANAKALVFAGLFFDGAEADSWLRDGLSIISRELPEQVLADGGNFELSPMYHAIFLEDMLDLINIASCYQLGLQEHVSTWREVATRMLGWLSTMLHPDGQISLFNDAAIGIAPSYQDLVAYAERLEIAPPSEPNGAFIALKDSGYLRLSNQAAVAILDVARIGPDYIPGHAHADTLSFELSVAGQRVVVNGGTSRYGDGPERNLERSTAWHSTVEVAGENSSEVWGGFRVGRRAYPCGLKTSEKSGLLEVSCSHDGYRYLRGRPTHTRTWRLENDYLTVVDSVSQPSLPAVARFILHPEITINGNAEDGLLLTLPNGTSLSLICQTGKCKVIDAQYAPQFGKRFPTKAIAVCLESGTAKVQFRWNIKARKKNAN